MNKMEVTGYDFRYNAFDVFYPLLYPSNEEFLDLAIQQHGDQTSQNIKVSFLTREERFNILAERYASFPRTRDDFWDFRLQADNVAKLTLNSFGLYGWKAMTIDYKAFLADAFKVIKQKGIQHLIIDIRQNNGGNDEIADELFQYIAKSNFNFEREGRTRYINFPESLKPFVQTWGDNPWYFNLEPKDKTPTGKYYIFKENYNSDKKVKHKNQYQGKIYLLTSSANTSLAFYTAYRFKQQKLGLMIGQETGGNLNDVNGGQILFLRLPNSQIEIDFPVMGGFAIEEQPNSGVIPDIKVKYQHKDIVEDRDPVMEATMDLIRKSGK